MKIRMKRSYSYEIDESSSRNLPKGGTFEVPDDVAKEAIKQGAAVKAGAPKKSAPKKDEGPGEGQGGGSGGSGQGGGSTGS